MTAPMAKIERHQCAGVSPRSKLPCTRQIPVEDEFCWQHNEAETKRREGTKDDFIAAMYKHRAVIRYACREANVSRGLAYLWRSEDADFAARWAEARKARLEELEASAVERAVDGVLNPVFQGGRLVGYRREYSDQLLIFMMRADDPGTYRETVGLQHGVQRDEPSEQKVRKLMASGRFRELVEGIEQVAAERIDKPKPKEKPTRKKRT